MHTVPRACLLALLAATGLPRPSSGQGLLNPTSGPAPIMKTLEQVEPRTPIGQAPAIVTKSGSYYLTGDLVVSQALASGISVLADNVDIDLNGFALVSQNSNTLDGIYQQPSYRNCRIRNGTISGWKRPDYYGIYGQGHGLTVEDVTIDACGSGIHGTSNLVVRNTRIVRLTSSGSGYGIDATGETQVESCMISDCSMGQDFQALRLGPGSAVRNTEIRGNRAGITLYGLLLDRGGMASGVSVVENGAGLFMYGYSLSEAGVIRDSTALSNTGGLDAVGFRLSGGAASVTRCTASRQHGPRAAIGMEAFSGSEIVDCIAARNGFGSTNGIGFRIAASTLRDSAAVENSLYGIELLDSSVALNNRIRNHTGSGDAGMLMEGFHSLVEGNVFINNRDGIVFENPTTRSNLVVRNRFIQSTPQLPGDNAYGVTVTVTNGYINTPDSEHPLANLRD